jgi:hypothetical protein
LINTITQNIDERITIQQNSLEMLSRDDEIYQFHANRTSSSSRVNLNKFKDPRTQHTRTILHKSPSLTSILTNSSSIPCSPEIIYWIELCIERGKDLSIKDFNGTSDPYVKIYYGNEEKYITNTIHKNLNPIWNEKFSFFVYDLNIPIYFSIFDYDRIGRDESMGSTKIDLWKLPLDTVSNLTLDLENEKRTDGKNGLLKISITITLKTSEFRDEVRIKISLYLILMYFIQVMRTLSKQSNPKSSLTGRSTGNNMISLTRRTIDVFIIEGRNLTGPGGVNKIFNPYIRMKFGGNKKYRTQV